MADAITVPQIITREGKGSALTNDELDANQTILRNAIVAAFGLLSTVLKTDGSLKDDSVGTLAVRDRVIGHPELKFTFAGPKADTGAANQYQIAFTPACSAYEDGQLFIVKATNANTGPSKLRVDALAYTKILKNGSEELAAGDIPQGGFFAAVYWSSAFHFLGGIAAGASGSGGSGGGFSGITNFEPADVSLPGANLAATFNHNFGTYPNKVSVFLVCVSTEHGYNAGEVVPIEDFYIVGGEPAFTTLVTTGAITVTQHSATIKVTQASDGTQQTITAGNWRIGCRAELFTSLAVNTFPDLNLQVANPDGALGYGQYVFFYHHNRHGSKLFLTQWNMQTGSLTLVETFPSERFELNVAGFRLSDGKDRMFMTMNSGADSQAQMIELQTPFTRSALKSVVGDATLHRFKCVWVTEGAGGVANPDMYFAESFYNAGVLTNAIELRKLIYAAGVYGAWTVQGIDLNLHHANIVNIAAFTAYHSANSSLLLFQYNPHNDKRRIYVITTSTGFLHIFHLLENTTSHATKTNALNANIAAWWPTNAGVGGAGFESTQMPMLTYEKSLALAGLGLGWNTPAREKIAVEYDFSTGKEISICMSRTGTPDQTGGIVRVPWRE